MRDLSATLLTAAQKATSMRALVKIVLSLSGQTTKTYTASPPATAKIISIKHSEEAYRQSAEVLLDNHDGALTLIDFKGYKGVISYGATTANGDEDSACAPLWVVGQQMLSWQGGLACSLALAGTPNFLNEDGASAVYAPDSSNTDTVKTILTAIAEATLACYSNAVDNFHIWTITFDDEAEGFFATSLVNTFQPKDGFRINKNESRMSAMKKLLRFTKCVMRVEDDEAIHIFQPTVSESSYDYTYELGAGNHAFFSLSNRKRLVIPYYIQVDSHPSHGDGYTGYAEDPDTATLVALDSRLGQREYLELRVEDNTQATAIATARLQHYQLDAQKGAASVPINFGAEVNDYVNCVDTRDNDTERAGNIGYLQRNYKQGKLTMDFNFGRLEMASLVGTMSPSISGGTASGVGLDAQINQLIDAYGTLADAINWILDWIEAGGFNPLAGYIYIDADGDIILNPASGRHTYGERIFANTRAKAPVGTRMYD